MPIVPASAAVRRAAWRAASLLGAALLAAPAATRAEPPTPAPEPPSVSELTVVPHCLSFPEARAYWQKHGNDGAPIDPDVFALASPGKGRRTEPSPGTKESLDRFFDSLWAGQPNYDDMSPRLAQIVHNQWGGDKGKVLGKPLAIGFMGVSRRGLDVYAVEWQCAKGIWAIAPLTPSGKVFDRAGRLLSYGSVNLLTGR